MGYFVKNRRIESGSTAVQIPTGSSATRPDAPVFGMIRYNTDLAAVEYFNGSIFQTLATSGGANYTVDTFTGNGSQTIYTMSIAESNADEVIVFVGSLYQLPTTNYTVDGGYDLTFESPPPDGVSISIIHTTS